MVKVSTRFVIDDGLIERFAEDELVFDVLWGCEVEYIVVGVKVLLGLSIYGQVV
jgi:hypothetical protein